MIRPTIKRGATQLCIVVILSHVSQVRADVFRHASANFGSNSTCSVVDTLIAIKLAPNTVIEDTIAFLKAIPLIDPSYSPWSYGQGFWLERVAQGATFDSAYARACTTSGVGYVNPVVAGTGGGLALLTDRVSSMIKESISAEQMSAIADSLGLDVARVDSATGRLWRFQKSGMELGTILQVCSLLFESGAVEFAEPVFASPNALCSDPNDPLFSDQWYLKNHAPLEGHDMNAIGAWQLTSGSPNVSIAFVDAGIEFGHLDFGNLAAAALGARETAATKPSNAATLVRPYERDIAGQYRDKIGTDADPSAELNKPITCHIPNSKACYHGTATAAMIFARKNNSVDMAGLAPECSISAVKVNADDDETGTVISEDFDAATRYILDTWRLHKVADPVEQLPALPIVSSQVSLAYETSEARACIDSLYAEGLLWVNSAGGRDEAKSVEWPGLLSSVISVTALNQADVPEYLIAYGPELDLSAAGVHVATLDPTGEYGKTNLDYDLDATGASQATPLVAGTAALVYSVRPDLIPLNGPPTTIISVLFNSADDTVGDEYLDTPGRDDFYGEGRVNAFRALLAVSRGNPNGDKVLDLRDVAEVMRETTSAAAPIHRGLSDLDCDGDVDQADVGIEFDIVFGGMERPEPCFQFDY